MSTHSLTAQKRTVTGRKVKHLRKKGILPATIYGKDFQSMSVQFSLKDFDDTLQRAGETSIIELSVDNKTHPALVHNTQRDPVTGALLHAELRRVDLKEKIQASIPIELVGEPPAVRNGIGILLRLLDTVEVEALPAALPESIKVDVASLVEVDQDIKVGVLNTPKDVDVLTDTSVSVVKIGQLTQKEPEPEPEDTSETETAQEAGSEVAEEQQTSEEDTNKPAEKSQEQSK